MGADMSAAESQPVCAYASYQRACPYKCINNLLEKHRSSAHVATNFQ